MELRTERSAAARNVGRGGPAEWGCVLNGGVIPEDADDKRVGNAVARVAHNEYAHTRRVAMYTQKTHQPYTVAWLGRECDAARKHWPQWPLWWPLPHEQCAGSSCGTERPPQHPATVCGGGSVLCLVTSFSLPHQRVDVVVWSRGAATGNYAATSGYGALPHRPPFTVGPHSWHHARVEEKAFVPPGPQRQ